jgi:hypothetical protein
MREFNIGDSYDIHINTIYGEEYVELLVADISEDEIKLLPRFPFYHSYIMDEDIYIEYEDSRLKNETLKIYEKELAVKLKEDFPDFEIKSVDLMSIDQVYGCDVVGGTEEQLPLFKEFYQYINFDIDENARFISGKGGYWLKDKSMNEAKSHLFFIITSGCDEYKKCLTSPDNQYMLVRPLITLKFNEDYKKQEPKMLEEISWEEFRETGLFWFVNTILHVFGLALVLEYDENNNLQRVFPARCKFRGFSEESNTKNYKKVTEYMKENIDDLLKDIEE